MKYKLVDRKEYANLLEEVAQLRRLVDALCVGLCDMPTDEDEVKAYLRGRNSARMYGWRMIRTMVANEMLRDLEHKKQTLIEDYPDLKVNQ